MNKTIEDKTEFEQDLLTNFEANIVDRDELHYPLADVGSRLNFRFTYEENCVVVKTFLFYFSRKQLLSLEDIYKKFEFSDYSVMPTDIDGLVIEFYL